MTDSDTNAPDRQFLRNTMASFIQIGALVLLLVFCYRILSPFVSILLWAIIIAVSIYPAHQSLTRRLGGREKTSAIAIVLMGLIILLVPAWLVADSTISGLSSMAEDLKDGAVEINPPSPDVADWPVIGKKVYGIWSEASTDLEETLNKFSPQLRALGEKAVGFAGHGLVTVLQFTLSIIIAGVLLMNAAGGYRLASSLATALVGEGTGTKLTDLSIQTIRSVFKGVLGVALIQAFFAAIGLVVMDVPAAGLIAGIVLVFAIVQLPVLIVLGPIAFWVFSIAEPVPATLFAIYAVIVSVSDAFLKPMLLGRGVEVPMLVILLGAIGGAFTGGIIGLFIGAVVLALGYEILRAWLNLTASEPPEAPAASA